MTTYPEDFDNPDFDNCAKCHEWKNYASEKMIEYWGAFTSLQKKIISECLQELADREDWE